MCKSASKRVSGPLLDRMNLQIAVGRPRASNRSLPELGLADCKDTRVSTDSGANHPEIPDGRCCLDVEGWTKLGTWTRCAVLTKLGTTPNLLGPCHIQWIIPLRSFPKRRFADAGRCVALDRGRCVRSTGHRTAGRRSLHTSVRASLVAAADPGFSAALALFVWP